MTPTQTDQTNQTSPLSFMTESLAAKELWHDPSAPNLVSPPAFWPHPTFSYQLKGRGTSESKYHLHNFTIFCIFWVWSFPHHQFYPTLQAIPPQLRGQASPVGNDRWGPSKRDKKERPTNSCLQRWFQYCWISCTGTSVATYRMISI